MKVFLLIALFSVFGIYATFVNIYKENVTFTNEYYQNCPVSNTSLIGASYYLESNTYEFYAIMYHKFPTGWEMLNQKCNYRCNASYIFIDDSTDCMLIVRYNGTMMLSYNLTQQINAEDVSTPSPSLSPSNITTPSNTGSLPNNDLSNGAIAGIVIGSIVGLGLLVVIVYFSAKKIVAYRRNNARS
ncbi:hypothetical protein QKU48_gp0064 [Fadolivirus algeromassiliense]|jgi:hypothetical protein|uniref:Uncharacterized protein n=1 Tax=Fadolivirus FV1/VV64 TaxID=3070911 RepID=A0A7D3R091_9VIRU|nr:hypothetical protein QKU48_gp0064 [Fadolivirus algeromassiliense]QKF93522.1 hypothetical protein Fadolivirus_1_64 [Fadolivirus FV1/VV64]